MRKLNFKFQISNFKLRSGFTLIEVLVVISILGILGGISTFSISKSKDKGFDSRRKADLKAIETAAVAYYHDHGFYPPDPAAVGGTAFSSTSGGNWIPGLENYINKTPKDPKQAGLLYLLASFTGNTIQTGENLVAGIFTKPPQTRKTTATPQVAGTTTANITASATDGYIQYGASSYAPDPSGSCTVVSTTGTTNSIGQTRGTTGNYYKWRSYVAFDTSAIPAGSTINSVTLTQNLSTKANVGVGFNLLALNYNWANAVGCPRWGGSPPSATQVGTQATSTLPANGANFTMTLNNSVVSIGGISMIMLVSDKEINNTTPSAEQSIQLSTAEAANPPQLSVTYTPPVTPSLVGYWKLDEASGTSASDSSGNGNTGTITGTWAPTWTTGKYGNGLNLDGTSGHYLNIPGSPSLDLTGPFTISGWVKPTVLPNGVEPVIIKTSSGAASITLFINTDSKAYFGMKNGGNLNAGTLTALTAGTWAYLTGIYDGSNLKIYLNGVLQNTTPITYTPPPLSGNPFQFGDADPAVDDWWWQYNGVLDEVRAYNYAISQSQILTDMNNGVPPAAPTVTTGVATSVSSTQETIAGSANPNGYDSTGWFRYSITTPGTCNATFDNDVTGGTRAPSSGGNSLPGGSPSVGYTQNIGGLTPSTTYYFCAIASNVNGTGYGTIVPFTTSAAVPVGNITASPSSGSSPITSTINWSTTPAGTGCTVSPPGWTGNTGSQSTGPLTSTTTYTLNCTNPGFIPVSATVTVSATPTADIKANGVNGPITVSTSDPPVSISWTSTGVTTTCTVTGGTGGSGTTGSFTWTATTTTTFNISCDSGAATDSVVVNVTLAGASTCPNTAFSYCYLVTADRSSFVIWAKLDNTSDPQTYNGSSATCTLTPPAATPPETPFNYCLDSSTL